MKDTEIKKKLILKKETLFNLSQESMKEVKGGEDISYWCISRRICPL